MQYKQIISVSEWKHSFKSPLHRGNGFMLLTNDNHSTLTPSSKGGGLWLKKWRHSPPLFARLTCAVLLHAPIGQYKRRFFLKEDPSCPCGRAPVETRAHIIHNCKRHARRPLISVRWTLSAFTRFLRKNPKAFAFASSALSAQPEEDDNLAGLFEPAT